MIDNDYNRSITWSKTHLTLPPIEIYSLNAFLDHFKISEFFDWGHAPPMPPVPAPLRTVLYLPETHAGLFPLQFESNSL